MLVYNSLYQLNFGIDIFYLHLFIHIQATAIPWASGTIFGILCLMVAALDYHLPESEGHELPQTTAEVKAWKESTFD